MKGRVLFTEKVLNLCLRHDSPKRYHLSYHHINFVKLDLSKVRTLKALPRMTSSVLAASGGDAICDVIVVLAGTEPESSGSSQIMAASADELEDEAEFLGITFSMPENNLKKDQLIFRARIGGARAA